MCRGDTGKTGDSDSKRVTKTENPFVRTRTDERNLPQKGEVKALQEGLKKKKKAHFKIFKKGGSLSGSVV